jgi:hypothetical protein
MLCAPTVHRKNIGTHRPSPFHLGRPSSAVPLEIYTYCITRCHFQPDKILSFPSVTTSKTKVLHHSLPLSPTLPRYFSNLDIILFSTIY